MASSFLPLAGEAIAEGLDLTSGDNEQFLKLNRHQCKYVAQKMSESREVLQVLEADVGYVVRCEAALKELYRVLTNALSLIKDCRFGPSLKKDDRRKASVSKDDHHESWLRAAITQRSYERWEDFEEICYDLQWCTSIVWISRSQSAATLQDVILVPEDCDGRLGPVDLFKLQRAAEYLLQIEGSYDAIPLRLSGEHIICITSITFKSNVRAYGPYGKHGKDSFKSESGKILGFWGGFGAILHNIGVFTVNPTLY